MVGSGGAGSSDGGGDADTGGRDGSRRDTAIDPQPPVAGDAGPATDDPDLLDRRAIVRVEPGHLGRAAGAGLPTGEGEVSVEQQRQSFSKRLDELEGVFQFMGKGHPDYDRKLQEIERLRAMLGALEP